MLGVCWVYAGRMIFGSSIRYTEYMRTRVIHQSFDRIRCLGYWVTGLLDGNLVCYQLITCHYGVLGVKYVPVAIGSYRAAELLIQF
jgi:hypothetical protein